MGGRLQDKVAIVTGSGSVGPGWGNGKAMSVLFAREGARVVGVDIDAEAAAATQQIITDEGGRGIVVVADVTRAADVERAVAVALENHGRIDILVNNVGIAIVGGPAELDEATWDRLMAVNIKSAYLTCHHVLPVMIRQHAGAIVNNASVAVLGWAGVNYGFYAASKGAMVAMTRTMAIRHAPDGIRANCVLPGLMNTPLVHAALTRVYGEDGDIDNLIRTRDAQCPLGHMGDAWDTAYATLFLASDEARVHHRYRTRGRWWAVGAFRLAAARKRPSSFLAGAPRRVVRHGPGHKKSAEPLVPRSIFLPPRVPSGRHPEPGSR
jgi:NAD(P)-dependent dehydrogenase (short-subunit alcohol dehydrogenase family)